MKGAFNLEFVLQLEVRTLLIEALGGKLWENNLKMKKMTWTYM